jgi:hypothetical protein
MKEGIKEGRIQGKIEEARRTPLRLGGKRFGAPPENVHAAIEAIQDVDRLEQLSERLLVVSTWAELITS